MALQTSASPVIDETLVKATARKPAVRPTQRSGCPHQLQPDKHRLSVEPVARGPALMRAGPSTCLRQSTSKSTNRRARSLRLLPTEAISRHLKSHRSLSRRACLLRRRQLRTTVYQIKPLKSSEIMLGLSIKPATGRDGCLPDDYDRHIHERSALARLFL